MTNAYLSELRKSAKDVLSGYAHDFAEECEDYFTNYVRNQEDICDIISQFADNRVDLYNYDLKQWAMSHVDALEDVIDEGLYDPSHNYDFFKHIQAAQYMAIENEINESLKDIVHYLAVSYLWRKSEKDYTENELFALDDYLDPYAMSTFDEIAEAVDNFIKDVE